MLAGAEGRPVGVLHSTLRGAPPTQGPAATPGGVAELVACGYAPAAAAGALAAAGGDADAALARLFWQLTGQGARAGARPAVMEAAVRHAGKVPWTERPCLAGSWRTRPGLVRQPQAVEEYVDALAAYVTDAGTAACACRL